MLKKLLNNENFYIFIITILSYLILHFIIKEILITDHTIQEGIKGEINRAIRDIGNVGKKIREIPRHMDKIGNKMTSQVSSAGRKIGGEVKNVGGKIDSGVKKTIKETQKMTSYIDSKFSWFLKEVETQTKILIFRYIVRFWELLGKAIKTGIIDPIWGLLKGLKNVFLLLFSILIAIFEKIISIPGCIVWYFFYSIRKITAGIFGFFLGKTIMGWVDTIWEVILWPFNKLNELVIKKYLGMDIWWLYYDINKRCYRFPLNTIISRMKKEFIKMGTNFSRGFGKIEFKF